jgi:hypothetical protein
MTGVTSNMINPALVAALLLLSPTPDKTPGAPTVQLHYRLDGLGGRPATHGRVWLYRYSYYNANTVRVGAAENGRLDVSFNGHAMPQLGRLDPKDDDHYRLAIELPGPLWFFSGEMKAKTVFERAMAEIESLAATSWADSDGTTHLALPDAPRRSIALVEPAGKPARNLRVSVSVHLGWLGHCARESGPAIGEFTTDSSGTIRITDPGNELYLETPNREPAHPDMGWDGVVVHRGDVSVKRLWGFGRWKQISLRLVYPDGLPARGLLTGAYVALQCGDAEEGTTGDDGKVFLNVIPGLTQWIAYWPDWPKHDRPVSLPDAIVKRLLKKGSATISIPRR